MANAVCSPHSDDTAGGEVLVAGPQPYKEGTENSPGCRRFPPSADWNLEGCGSRNVVSGFHAVIDVKEVTREMNALHLLLSKLQIEGRRIESLNLLFFDDRHEGL